MYVHVPPGSHQHMLHAGGENVEIHVISRGKTLVGEVSERALIRRMESVLEQTLNRDG